MAKVSIVVPNVSSPYLVAGVTSPSGQGVLKSVTSIPVVTLCYPSNPSYTLNSDMKITALYFKFSGASGTSRYAISTSNTFTFNSGSSNNMSCNFTFTMPLGPFGSPSFNVAGAVDIAAKTLIVNYSKVSPSAFTLVGVDIAGYVNT